MHCCIKREENFLLRRSLAGLDSLPNLLFLDVSDNLITSAMELIEPLPASIVFFNISGNPIVQQLENRLRRALIAALPRLRELDGYEARFFLSFEFEIPRSLRSKILVMSLQVEPEEIEEAEREFGVNASDEENEGMQSQEKKEETGTSDLAGHLAGLSLSERSTQQEAPDRSAEGRKHQEGVERDKSMLQSLLPSLMEGTSVEADINGLIAESKRNIQRAREQAMLRGRQRAEEERHNQADNMERIKGLKDRGPHAIRSSAARAIEEMRGRSGTGDRNQDLG